MSLPGTSGLSFHEPLLYEKSRPGRIGYQVPPADVPEVPMEELIPADLLRTTPADLPEVSENEVLRHFVRLSQWNYAIDTGMFPLGSCTMKYNPRLNELVARLPGFARLHPHTPVHLAQGALRLMWELERDLAEITGMDAVTLQPAAGAHGELTALMMVRAYHTDRGNPRKKVLVPESAHGTNAASSAMCGYEVVTIKNGPRGIVEVAQVEELMDEDVACLMLTNPNTLGLFEGNIKAIAEVVHQKGGLVYGDGANMNALLGISRPGDVGIDLMQLNLHKTFSTPHGGGGPGSGPVAVKKALAPYLPAPRVMQQGEAYTLEQKLPHSIGKVRSFYGNFGMMVRAWAYIHTLGPDGLRRISEMAVLNANYIRVKLSDVYHLPYEVTCMHEVVFTDKIQNTYGVKTLDIAKRLIDFGFHPPTVYFPLVVHGALMIEPTESETRETLDQFIEAMRKIAEEAATEPDTLHQAPTVPVRRRLDETTAARKPVLRWVRPGVLS